MSKNSRLLITVFVLNLLFHLGIVFAVSDFENPKTWEAGTIAENLWNGKGYCLRGQPTSWIEPGYPFTLLAFWKIFGKTPAAYIALQTVQACLISTMIFPLYLLAMRWFNNNRVVAWVTVAITVLMPLYGWYPTRIHRTAIVFAVVPWMLLCWLRLLDSPSRRWAIMTGLCTGVLGLFQPLFLGIFGVFGLVGLVRAMRLGWSQTLNMILCGLLVLAVLAPWTFRNYQVQNKVILVKSCFGKEFWHGNNPNADGASYLEGGKDVLGTVPPKALVEWKGPISEAQLMSLLQKEAWDYCTTEPGAFVLRTLKKIGWFWTATPARYMRDDALKFRSLHLFYWIVFVVSMTVAVVLGRPLKREYVIILLGLIFVYSALYGLLHVGQARFRGEVEYIFIPLVSYGLFVAASRIKSMLNKNG